MTARRLIAAVGGGATFALCSVVLHLSPLTFVRLALLGAALGAVVESDLAGRRILDPRDELVHLAGRVELLQHRHELREVALADGISDGAVS
jgi:hypothetical protein